MDEVLSITEIEAKFDSEWVLIEDPRTDEALEVQAELCAGTGRTGRRSTAGLLRFVPNDLPLCIPAKCLKTPPSYCEFHF